MWSCRAGGNGTAVPVFEVEKWRRGSPLLGTSNTSSSLQAVKAATRELRLLNFLLAILEREMSTQIGEGLTCASCVAVTSGSSV